MYNIEDILEASKWKLISSGVFFLLSIITFFFGPLYMLIGGFMIAYSIYTAFQVYRDITSSSIVNVSGKCVDFRYSTYKGGVTRHIVELKEDDGRTRTYSFNVSGKVWQANDEYISIYYLEHSKIILGGEGISKKEYTIFEKLLSFILIGILLFMLVFVVSLFMSL